MGDTIQMKKPQKTKSLSEYADELESMVATMCKSIVDHPEDIVIERAISPTGFIAFEVTCRDEDTGTLIGQRGANAECIRKLLMAAAMARRVRVTIMMSSQSGPRR